MNNNIYPTILPRNNLSLKSEIENLLTEDKGLNPEELNSIIYKNDYKKIRENLSKDVSKYHSIEKIDIKIIRGLSTFIYLLGFLSFVMSGIDAIMSSMILNGTVINLTQEKFNQAMLITNWLDIIFLILAGLIELFNQRLTGN